MAIALRGHPPDTLSCMRCRSFLLSAGAVLALTATVVTTYNAQAIVGGTESTEAYSFMGSFQLVLPQAATR